MIIVTMKTKNGNIDVCLTDPAALNKFITVMEQSPTVENFKVSLPEGIVINDLYNTFGIGYCEKFCTAFF